MASSSTLMPLVGCHGKIQYASEANALRRIKEIAKAPRRKRVPTRAYECPSCLCWHISIKSGPTL